MADDSVELNAGTGGNRIATQSATRDSQDLDWQEVFVAGFDGSGNIQQVSVTSEGVLEVTDLVRAASRGQITGMSVFHRFGQNPDIDTGTAPEDIEYGGGTVTLPTSAAQVTAVSGSADDTAAGTGARTVTITYLDASYVEQTETIALNGTSNVTTTGNAIRFVRAFVATAGSGGENAGALTFTIGGDLQATIGAGLNQTFTTHYTVPASSKASFLYYECAQSGGASDTVLDFLRRDTGGVWRPFKTITFESGGATRASGPVWGVEFAAQTDLRIRATSVSANNVLVRAEYYLLVYPA